MLRSSWLCWRTRIGTRRALHTRAGRAINNVLVPIEMVCHGGLVHAKPSGHRGVGVAGTDTIPDEPRRIEQRESVALLVFGHLRVRIRRRVANDDRHLLQPDALRCTPPLGAKVNLVSVFGVSRMDDDGLQDAVLANVLREFVQVGVRDLGARVVGVLMEAAVATIEGRPAALPSNGTLWTSDSAPSGSISAKLDWLGATLGATGPSTGHHTRYFDSCRRTSRTAMARHPLQSRGRHGGAGHAPLR